MGTEQFTNDLALFLAGAVAANATALTLTTSPPDIPVPIRVTVDTEVYLCTAINGNVITVVPGYEGSTSAAHAAGARIWHLVTAGMLQDMYPAAPLPITSGSSCSVTRQSRIIEIALQNPQNFTINIDPTILIPGAVHTVVDVNGMVPGNSITLALETGTINGQPTFPFPSGNDAVSFYTNGTNLRII